MISAQAQTMPPELINAALLVNNVDTVYDPASIGDCPGGVFTIDATFENTSGREIADIHFEIAQLTAPHAILNTDGGPGGTGSLPGVPGNSLGGDNFLNAGEAFTQTFEVCLGARSRFTLLVDVYGVVQDLLAGLAQAAYVKASNTRPGDRFSRGMALEGDTLAVGADMEDSFDTGVDADQDDDFGDAVGAVYVFKRNIAGMWSQQAYIKASRADHEMLFGGSLALSDHTLAVGAEWDDGGASGINGDQRAPGFHNGAAYVFERDATDTWSQQAYIKASNSDQEDEFGSSVALEGDTLAVGARAESSSAMGVDGNQADNSTPDAGAAYVFTRGSAGQWSQQAYIKSSNTDAQDLFGHRVALDGDTIAVSAPEEDSSAVGVDGDQADNSAHGAGAVYIFTRNASGQWSQQAYLKASNTNADDNFGSSIALDGDTLAVSARFESSAATGINGDQLDNGASDAGAVYVFSRDASGVWSQQAYLKASNTDPGDRFGSGTFGSSVALQGDTLIVGAYAEDSSATGTNGDQTDNAAPGAGAVYVYTRNIGGIWSQRAYIKASNTEAGDRFGSSVALDASTLVIGSTDEDGNAKGIDGDEANNASRDSGAVYVFE